MNLKELVGGFILAALFIILILASCNAQSTSPEFSIDSSALNKWIDTESQELDTLQERHYMRDEMRADTIMDRGTLIYLDWKGEYHKELVELKRISWFCPEGDLVYIDFQFFTQTGRVIPWKIIELKERRIFKL